MINYKKSKFDLAIAMSNLGRVILIFAKLIVQLVSICRCSGNTQKLLSFNLRRYFSTSMKYMQIITRLVENKFLTSTFRL